MDNRSSSPDDKSIDDNPCSDYSENELHVRAMWLYAAYPTLVAGTVGHLLTVFFILHAASALRSDAPRSRRRFALPPVAVYLLPMAVSGLTALYSGLLPELIKQYSCFSLDPISSGHGGAMADFKCRIVYSLHFYSIQLYSWLAVCIAIERACAILVPHTYGRWFGGGRRRGCNVSKIAVCTGAIILLAINVLPLVSYGIDEHGECTVLNRHLIDVYMYVDCILYSLMPLAVMIPCNAVVLWSVVRWRRQRSYPSTDGRPTSRAISCTTRRALPLSVASLCFNVTLLLTVAQVVIELRREDQQSDEEQGVDEAGANLFWSIGMLSSYFFCSGSFYVYLAVSVAFCQSAKQLLLSASVAKFGHVTRTGDLRRTFTVLREDAAPAEMSCGTSAGDSCSDAITMAERGRNCDATSIPVEDVSKLQK